MKTLIFVMLALTIETYALKDLFKDFSGWEDSHGNPVYKITCRTKKHLYVNSEAMKHFDGEYRGKKIYYKFNVYSIDNLRTPLYVFINNQFAKGVSIYNPVGRTACGSAYLEDSFLMSLTLLM